MRIIYRKWMLEDAENIRRILRETWLDAYSEFISHDDLLEYLDERYNLDTLKTFIEDPDIVGFIAEVDDIVAGYEKTFYNNEDRQLYVHQLYILPQYQGMGIGKQLMTFAAERAKTYNLDRIWLGVMVDNTPAFTWYQKMGYKVLEKAPIKIGKATVEHYIGYVPVDGILNDK